MEKREAMEAVIKMAAEGRPGDFTTGICEALGISFDNFLRFAQTSRKQQAFVIGELAKMFELKLATEKFGHSAQ
jgi:hypothetical protein